MSRATKPQGRIDQRQQGVRRYRRELHKMIRVAEQELRREVRSAIKRAQKDRENGGTGVAIIQEGGRDGRKSWARILIGNWTRAGVDKKISELLPDGWRLEACRLHSRARRELTDWRIVGHFPAKTIE